MRTLLWRGVTKRCPACGSRGLFTRWLRIAERCPRCGLRFERIEGHWIGAIGMNTILTFASLLVFIVAVLLAFWDRVESPVPIAATGVVFALAVPPLIDPITRTLWTAIDIAMRPLEPHEVDWMIVDPGAIAPERRTDAEPTSVGTADDPAEESDR